MRPMRATGPRPVAINETLTAGNKEVLRTALALQSGGLCAADWKKGEKFVAQGSRDIGK